MLKQSQAQTLKRVPCALKKKVLVMVTIMMMRTRALMGLERLLPMKKRMMLMVLFVSSSSYEWAYAKAPLA